MVKSFRCRFSYLFQQGNLIQYRNVAKMLMRSAQGFHYIDSLQSLHKLFRFFLLSFFSLSTLPYFRSNFLLIITNLLRSSVFSHLMTGCVVWSKECDRFFIVSAIKNEGNITKWIWEMRKRKSLCDFRILPAATTNGRFVPQPSLWVDSIKLIWAMSSSALQFAGHL